MILRFEALPRAIRQSAVSLIGYRNTLARYGPEYRQTGDFLKLTKRWDTGKRMMWQRDKLSALCKAARAGTAYYQKHLPPQEEIESASDLQGALDLIPLLNKQTLKRESSKFRNTDYKETHVSSTSGSTGSPLKVGHDKQSIQRRFAFLSDHLHWVGLNLTDPSVRLSGRVLCSVDKAHKTPWLYNGAEQQLFLSTYHLDGRHRNVITQRLKALKPLFMDGYPSAIRDTLWLLKQEGIELPSLRVLITTAETLHQDLRDELEELSGATVLDYYSASEGVPFIQQCPLGTYHVRWQSGIFEVTDNGTTSLEGDGELVISSFVQDRTPLIRYRTGDLVQGLQQDPSEICRCGMSTPTVKSVNGRLEDLVQTTDGRALSMFTYRTLKTVMGLKETQVVQHDFDTFEVVLVPDSAFDHSFVRDQIKANFERALGYSICLSLTVVETIPRGAAGKMRLVVSKVKGKQ